MRHVHWIKNETYCYPLLVYIGTWAQLRAYIKRRYILDLGECIYGGGCHQVIESLENVGCRFSMVWLPRWDSDDWADIRVLSHELLHAAMSILNVCGVPFDFNNQESLCYLHEDLNRQAHKELGKCKQHDK